MKVINIQWDTDSDKELLEQLPKEIKIPEHMKDKDEILSLIHI